MDNVKRESPLFLRKMSPKTLEKSAFETDSGRVDTFLSKEVFRLSAWWFELVPAVPNLRKKVISKSWSGLRWQEETRQGKKRDKNAEADDKKVELVSYGQWGCPSLLTLSTNVKLLKPCKQVYWVSIHASVSFLKHQSLNLSKMQDLRWDNWKCFVLLIFLSAFAPSPRQPHFIHRPLSQICFFLSRFKLRDLHYLLCLVLNTLQMW